MSRIWTHGTIIARRLRVLQARNSPQIRYMSHFTIKSHTIRTQHTRDRPAGAERGRDNDLRLHVKQYTPKTNPSPKPGDVTLIGAHANGFPKELYEPFWDDVCEKLQAQGRQIRGIWIADIASQGQSGILNEEVLGPDASWWDHGRDLLHLINTFQDSIPHPIIGVGHSVGASHLTHLSHLHPRLLHSLILIDPIIQLDLKIHKLLAKLSTPRRDTWPSRKAAAASFRSSKFYKTWDARVLEKWIEFGLRDLPTELYPEIHRDGSNGVDSDVPVTLSTTVAQEVYFYVRASYRDKRLLQDGEDDEDLLRDIHPEDRDGSQLCRPESQALFRMLPEVKPSVQYIFGKQSEASTPEKRLAKMESTGTGVGGSGGVKAGKVKEVVLDCGHLVGFEAPGECAEATASFIDAEVGMWEAQERRRDEALRGLERRERVGINERWREEVGGKGKLWGREARRCS